MTGLLLCLCKLLWFPLGLSVETKWDLCTALRNFSWSWFSVNLEHGLTTNLQFLFVFLIFVGKNNHFLAEHFLQNFFFFSRRTTIFQGSRLPICYFLCNQHYVLINPVIIRFHVFTRKQMINLCSLALGLPEIQKLLVFY